MGILGYIEIIFVAVALSMLIVFTFSLFVGKVRKTAVPDRHMGPRSSISTYTPAREEHDQRGVG
jgi:uncharacterized membrane protein YqhA